MGRIRKQIRAAAMVGLATGLVAGVVLGTASTAGARTQQPRTTKPVAVTEPVIVRSAPLSKPLVILYGDSLADEAVDSFVAAFAAQPGVQVTTRTAGGTAICDFLGDMRKDAATLAPGAVVIEFSGNAL